MTGFSEIRGTENDGGTAPVLLWFRRDLRLDDHPALAAALSSGRPVIPVFLCDETIETLGAAPKWRLGAGVEALSDRLSGLRARLILRRGRALDCLRALIAETGAGAVYWQRVYDPDGIARDRSVKAALSGAGIPARSFAGALLFEPWSVATGQGRPYAVFTPFWRAIRVRDAGAPLAAPKGWRAPAVWPRSDRLADWDLGRGMGRGAAVVARHAGVGEETARARLARFLAEGLARYPEDRDHPARQGTSGLSENLAWGEISVRRVWQAALEARDRGNPGAEKFLSELAWREFAGHLLYHHPTLASDNWRAGWDGFAWRGETADAECWRRGMTGEPFVDAAMREMFVTGRMHNRARMVAASYLTKHLLTDWRIGLGWFADCLTDWDPAANALGWQWVAGSGPDAAPYFRIFNPARQADTFDAGGEYRRRWLAEGRTDPPETALDYFRAAPHRWGLSAAAPPPRPLVALDEGRRRALAAYAALDRDERR